MADHTLRMFKIWLLCASLLLGACGVPAASPAAIRAAPVVPRLTPLATTAPPTQTPQVDATTAGEAAVETDILKNADPARGQILFNTFQGRVGAACAGCHRVDTEDRLIGPGLLNVGARAETRATGQDAVQYLYTAIADPGVFVVESYPDIMPKNWGSAFDERQMYDLIAYLLTLRG